MHPRLAAAICAVLLSLFAARAEAHIVRFLGPHPIPAKDGGGYCYIEAPHLHSFSPDHANLYQQVDRQYVFTGDPTPFGYEGDKHPFYGHHPVVLDAETGAPVYCLLDGPHFHAYAAPTTAEYQMNNGVAFYVAPIPDIYIKPHHVKLVNAEYRPFVALRPTIEVTPPPEWHGEVWVAPPVVEVAAPGIAVAAPGIAVAAPGVSVEVRGPGFFAPPPPPVVGVEVRGPRFFAPGPPGVVVGAPGPVFVGGPRPGRWERHEERVERHEMRREMHHDNGRHGGWHR